jgi:membrane protein YdbS with pleckstrin-like domain
MENTNIQLRPAATYAFMKCLPLILLSVLFLFLSWKLSPAIIWFSLAASIFVLYRYVYIRRLTYLVTSEYIRITNGILLKRVDQVELFRVKDYIIIQPPVLQLFGLMNVILKSTDGENPVVRLYGIPRSDLIDELRSRVQQARKNNNIYEIN